MEIIIAFLLVCFGLSNALAQQNAGTSASNDKMKAVFIQLDRDWAAATVRNDVAFMKNFVADDCLFTEAGGTVGTKTEMLRDMAAGTITTNQPSDYSVRLFGPDMAVIRHNMNVAGTEKSGDASGDYRRMHVLVRRNSQ